MATPDLLDPLDPSDLKDPQASLAPPELRVTAVLLDPRALADLKVCFIHGFWKRIVADIEGYNCHMSMIRISLLY